MSLEELAERRQQLLQGGGSSTEIASLDERLRSGWETRRRERAERDHGPRDAIMKRARIHLELEKLSS